jgi:hypothetical protein
MYDYVYTHSYELFYDKMKLRSKDQGVKLFLIGFWKTGRHNFKSRSYVVI